MTVSREKFEKVASAVFFIGFIAAQLVFGNIVAIRVLGVGCILPGLVWVIDGSVSFGMEDRPPSFFLRGVGARLVGIAMAAFGIFLLFYSRQAVCLFGWADGSDCP